VWVRLHILLSLLGNNLLNKSLRERRIVGGVAFYAARVVSKEIRRLVLPGTYCYVCHLATLTVSRMYSVDDRVINE
jgi:hypothetical protein